MATDRQFMQQLLDANAAVLTAELRFQSAVTRTLPRGAGGAAVKDAVQQAMDELRASLREQHDALAALQTTLSGG